MDNLFAVVSWSNETNVYSSVKVSKLQFDREVYLDSSSLVVHEFDVKLNKNSGETHLGRVIEVGKCNCILPFTFNTYYVKVTSRI